ncbi:MAG: hypothetical protein JNL62_29180, partial [Bryobacterales bacterium]|nr:hypothetical protein [Bryobacterales bacterium]
IDQEFWMRLAILAGIALISVLGARFYVHRLIEVWARRLRDKVGQIASGKLDTRITRFSSVRDFAAVEHGINAMASEIEAHRSQAHGSGSQAVANELRDLAARMAATGEAVDKLAGGLAEGQLVRADLELAGGVRAQGLRLVALPALHTPLLGMDILGRMRLQQDRGRLHIELQPGPASPR